MNRLDKAKQDMDNVYGLDWVQCTYEMQDKVKGLDDYGAKSEDSNVIWPLDEFQGVTSGLTKNQTSSSLNKKRYLFL